MVTIYSDAGYPPYSYVDDGKAVGIYAEIMRRAFARMPRYAVTIEPGALETGPRAARQRAGICALSTVSSSAGTALDDALFRTRSRRNRGCRLS